eukprot:scaffold1736_cov127-Cylindrotheca_fusiformis.AAC.60
MKQIYRNNIVHRMGGEFGFDFLIMTYCENILDDESLDRFFGNFDLKALTFFQKELLLITFLEPNAESNARRKRVRFRNELMGLDRTYFAVLERHFVDALDDCFITGLDYELCKAYFAELHDVFKEVSEHSKYKDQVVERMGGEATFDLLVVDYCERIHTDTRLGCFFGTLSLHSLTLLQKELLQMTFLKPTAENKIDSIKSKMILKFGPIFALGLNESHFDILEGHFSAALYECSSKPDVIQACQKHYASLLSFFQENALDQVEEEEQRVDQESPRVLKSKPTHRPLIAANRKVEAQKGSDDSSDTVKTEDSSVSIKPVEPKTPKLLLFGRKRTSPRLTFSWKSTRSMSRRRSRDEVKS